LLARERTVEALETLTELMRKGSPDSVRAYAANAILDRGYGKPPAQHLVAKYNLGDTPPAITREMTPLEASDAYQRVLQDMRTSAALGQLDAPASPDGAGNGLSGAIVDVEPEDDEDESPDLESGNPLNRHFATVDADPDEDDEEDEDDDD
jgi:hypothetical protein